LVDIRRKGKFSYRRNPVVTSSDTGRIRELRRVRNVWEIEADETAFGFLWGYMITTRANRERFARRLRCGGGEHPEVTLISRLIYAVSFVFFLLGQAHGSIREALILRLWCASLICWRSRRPPWSGWSPECRRNLSKRRLSMRTQAEAAWNRPGPGIRRRRLSGHNRRSSSGDQPDRPAARKRIQGGPCFRLETSASRRAGSIGGIPVS